MVEIGGGKKNPKEKYEIQHEISINVIQLDIKNDGDYRIKFIRLKFLSQSYT
jgi:hypothetical protein